MNTPTKARQQNLIQETFSRLQARLLAQLQVMSRDLNTEAVHQTRIAIRRLRAALRAMKPYLRASLRRRLIATLRQLTSNLEATREADIRELAVKTLLGGLYVADRSQAHQLRVTVAAQRATARQELRDLLTSAAWRHRLSLLQRDSRQPLVNPSRKDSLLLIRDVLARRQHRLHHALHHVGRNPRKLHRLRLRIKASRYLDEDFGSLMSASPDRELKSLRELQNRLGEYHDNWRLKKWLRRESTAHPITVALCGDLKSRQAHLRKAVSRLSKTTRELAHR